jgi:hypothetical protein
MILTVLLKISGWDFFRWIGLLAFGMESREPTMNRIFYNIFLFYKILDTLDRKDTFSVFPAQLVLQWEAQRWTRLRSKENFRTFCKTFFPLHILYYILGRQAF